jgi:hypothetical protein
MNVSTVESAEPSAGKDRCQRRAHLLPSGAPRKQFADRVRDTVFCPAGRGKRGCEGGISSWGSDRTKSRGDSPGEAKPKGAESTWRVTHPRLRGAAARNPAGAVSKRSGSALVIAEMFPAPPVAPSTAVPRLRPRLPECQVSGEQDDRRAARTRRRRARTTHRENAPRCI